MGLSDRGNRDAHDALDALTRDLLHAARARRAPATARDIAVDVALAAYSPAASVGPLGGERSGAPSPGAFARGAAGWKLAGVVFVLVVGAGAAAVLLGPRGDRASSPARSVVQPPVAPEAASLAAIAPEPALAEPAPARAALAPSISAAPVASLPSPSPIHVAAARPARQASPSLSDELALLDRVRTAIASSEPARALLLLDDHAARFPAGSLRAEAAVLRIEATAKAGEPGEARRLAKAFSAAHPESPYAARIASVVSDDP